MRVSVLSTIGLLVLVVFAAPAATARAQESIPNPFATLRQERVPGSELGRMPHVIELSAVDEPEFRESGMGAHRTGDTTFLPLGDQMLVSQTSSYYPVANTKLRSEGLFIANRIDDRTAIMFGAWRLKHRTEGLPALRTGITYGVSWTRSF